MRESAVSYSLKDERGTLAKVAAILRKQNPPLALDGEEVGFLMESSFSDYPPLVAESERLGFGPCGSAACIGGHAWLLENPNGANSVGLYMEEATRGSGGLWDLYYAPEGMPATAEQAAQAIDNYLAYGKPRWETIEGLRADADDDQ